MNQPNAIPDALYDLPREVQLMIDRAAEGVLDEQAEAELRRTAPIAVDAITAYDVAAASLFLATVSADAKPTISRTLEQRLQQAGRAWCKQQAAGSAASSLAASTGASSLGVASLGGASVLASGIDAKPPLVLRGQAESSSRVAGMPSEPSPSRLRVLPWLAAAAGIALAAAAWWSPARTTGISGGGPIAAAPGVAQPAMPALSQAGDQAGDQAGGQAADQTSRQALAKDTYLQLASATTALKLSWGDWSDANVACEKPGVKGDVVWDEARKTGVMKFANLPKLDATKEQYQLWIIDSRGMEQRISGGVFNGFGGEQYVLIDPGIAVDRAAAFAVTIERPDGVWVSDMKRRVVIAAAS